MCIYTYIRKCHNVTAMHNSATASDLDTEKPIPKQPTQASQPSPTNPKGSQDQPQGKWTEPRRKIGKLVLKHADLPRP